MILNNKNRELIIEYLIDFPFSTAKEIISYLQSMNPKLSFQAVYLCLKNLEKDNIIDKFGQSYNLSNTFLKYIKKLYKKSFDFQYNKFDSDFFSLILNKKNKITVNTSNLGDAYLTAINMRLAAISLKPNTKYFTIVKHYSTFLVSEKLILSAKYDDEQNSILYNSLKKNQYNIYGDTSIDQTVKKIMRKQDYQITKKKTDNIFNNEYVIADDIIITAKYDYNYEKFSRYLSEKETNFFPSDSYFRYIKYEYINSQLTIEKNKEKAQLLVKKFFE